MILVAHRGASGTAPENTMAAFRQAVAQGAAMIELDVRWSSDLVPVVHHDRTVTRTTNGRGHVWRTTAADLRNLDAGSWFDRRYCRERIPTLAHVLQHLPPRVGLNVEIKTDGDPRPVTLRLTSLLGVLEHHAGDRPLILTSFDHGFLRRLHRRSPRFTLGVLQMPVRDLPFTPARLARRVGATFYVTSVRRLRRIQVMNARRHDLQVAVYGVNSEQALLRARAMDVDVIMTDFPAEMLRLLRKG
jgi:glycerophosphoryl diester phosphodiesterase